MKRGHLPLEDVRRILLQSPLNTLGSLFDHVYGRENLARICETVAIVPPASQESVLLDIGCYAPMLSVYHESLGYGNMVAVSNYDWEALSKEHQERGRAAGFNLRVLTLDVEKERLPLPDQSVDVVLLLEVLEHFSRDPLFVMAEINRVMKPGGKVVLSTPNSVGAHLFLGFLTGNNPYNEPYNAVDSNRHNRLYSPAEMARLGAACGFSLEYLDTIPLVSGRKTAVLRFALSLLDRARVSRRERSSGMRGDIVLARFVKTGPVVDRFPEWLYISRQTWKDWYEKVEQERGDSRVP